MPYSGQASAVTVPLTSSGLSTWVGGTIMSSMSADQVLTPGLQATILLDTVVNDSGGYTDIANSAVLAPTAGLYTVQGQVAWTAYTSNPTSGVLRSSLIGLPSTATDSIDWAQFDVGDFVPSLFTAWVGELDAGTSIVLQGDNGFDQDVVTGVSIGINWVALSILKLTP